MSTHRIQSLVGWAFLVCLLTWQLGCDVMTESLSNSGSSESKGSSESGAPKLPSNFFSDIPLPDGSSVTAVGTDEFGDPVVTFSVPSPAQPLHAWFTIESDKQGWAQISSAEYVNGGGRGLFSHKTDDRFYEMEIEAIGENETQLMITYRGANITGL